MSRVSPPRDPLLPMGTEDLLGLVEEHFSCRLGAPRSRCTTRYGGRGWPNDPYAYQVLIFRYRTAKATPTRIEKAWQAMRVRLWHDFYDLWMTCRRSRPALYWRFESKIKEEIEPEFIQLYTRVAIPDARWDAVWHQRDSVNIPARRYLSLNDLT